MYLNNSPYCDAEGSSQLISCLHDEINNSDPIIGEKITNWDCIDSIDLKRVKDAHMTKLEKCTLV